MTTNLNSGGQDLDQMFITNQELIDRFIGSGTLWAWGNDNFGQLGLGTSGGSYTSPAQVGTLTNWKQVSSGGVFNAAIKTDNTLWMSGSFIYTVETLTSSPVQIGILTDWGTVSCTSPTDQTTADPNVLAIKTNGTLWGTGANSTGELGLGDTTFRTSFTQVGALTNWKQISIHDHSAAIKTDDTLWTWGQNANGQLGLGNGTVRYSPVQVGALTNWKQVSAGYTFTAAIKTDGTLWTWGRSNTGQLGLGDVADRSSPVQVGTQTNWKYVSAGVSSALAIKTDGSLWGWGRNVSGQLGLGDIVDRSSPVQVGTLTNWKQVSAGGTSYVSTAAIKTDGTLWGWGINVYGPIGVGDQFNRSSPVQVGTLTNWTQVSAGGSLGSTMAIKY